MAMAPNAAGAPTGEDTHQINAPGLNYFVFALFFIFGGITSLNDVILPKLKELFTLSYTEAMLVQFCFFTAYLVIGIPGAALVKRLGYMKGAVAGLVVMLTGCLLFIPASMTATYGLFLAALFVLASGVVIVQVVANPLISMLGKPETTHSRLTFAQAFNALGTTIFPLVGAALILGGLATVSADQLSGAALDAYRTAESQAIVNGYIGIAIALAVVAAAVWMFRGRLPHNPSMVSETPLVSTNRYIVGLALIIAGAVAAVYGYYALGLILMLAAPAAWLYGNSLLTRARFSYGAMCIFLYVGAEVSIGSFIINYLLQDSVMASGGAVTTWINGTVTAIVGLFGSTKTLEPNAVEWMIGLYWGGAMIGRFIGAAVLRYVSPGLVLAGVSFGAIMLILLSINSTGELAGYSLLCVGLMNSIMFPTIFSLACEKLGARAADGSGIINIAIFGGAVIPLITGMIADKTGSLAMSFILPAICYAIIAGFGIFARRPA